MNLDQQVRQLTQRPTEGVVHALSAGVGRDLGGQTCQKPGEGLRSVTLQREEVLQLADHPFYDLALSRRPPAIGLRPCPARVLVGGGGHQSPVDLLPATRPLDPRETFVRQVGLVKVFGYERFPYGALVGVRGARPKAVITPCGSTTSATLNP
jgi:hypothetical protein